MNSRVSKLAVALLCVSVGTLSGCRLLLKRERERNQVSAEVDAGAPVVGVTEEAIPAPQDFEEEAAEKVTPSNYKAENSPGSRRTSRRAANSVSRPPPGGPRKRAKRKCGCARGRGGSLPPLPWLLRILKRGASAAL